MSRCRDAVETLVSSAQQSSLRIGLNRSVYDSIVVADWHVVHYAQVVW